MLSFSSYRTDFYIYFTLFNYNTLRYVMSTNFVEFIQSLRFSETGS